MDHLSIRRKLVLAATSLPLVTACALSASPRRIASVHEAQLAELETQLDGRLGVFAIDTANGALLGFRADERFPLCSTFKVMLVSAILARSVRTKGLLQQRIHYTSSDLVTYSPISEKQAGEGMTVEALCGAAVQYSDNTASNLLMKVLGGPAAVTAFARSVGDREFRLDRWETALNSAIPGDPRDTSTPSAVAMGLCKLVLGSALAPDLRRQLRDWLQGNTTGAARIRAGVPADWRVGDRTGGGDYGTANAIAVLWPPGRAPVVLAIYSSQHRKDAQARNDIIAAAATVVVDWLDSKV
jgi:beta-lactamase class A